jgi:aminopeptidase N
MLGLPSQSDLANELHIAGETPDPDAIWSAVDAMKQAQSKKLSPLLQPLYEANQVSGPYAPDAQQSGKRSLANSILYLITRSDGGALAQTQYDQASNMTQQLSALANLIRAGKGDAALAAFENQWKDDRLVMDKWFGLQVMEAAPDDAADTATALTKHALFNWKNPNRFRATLGALSMHHAGFHAKDGSGYALLADWLIQLDPLNPQTTARMCSAFQTWRRYDQIRQTLISTQLERIANTPNLSRDTAEMISRIRGA